MRIINEFLAGKIKPDTVLLVELFVILSMVLYWPVVSFQYIYYDDPGWIFGNPIVMGGLSWKSLHWAMTGLVNDTWCPLTNLSFILECQFFGVRPAVSHLVSFLLHLANVLLLFRFMLLLIGKNWRAVLVTLLFAIHPMNVQAVASVAERKGVLSTLFLLLMLLSYLKYVKAPSRKGYWRVFIWYALSLAAKPSVLTVPLALLLLDVWPLARFNGGRKAFKRVLLEKVPLLTLALADGVVEYLGQRNSGGIASFSFMTNVQTTVIGLARYVANLVYPIDLNICYFHPVNYYTGSWPEFLVFISACLLVAISLISWLMWRREKGFVVCWVIFLVLMAPVIQFIPAGHIYMADRYVYVPYIWLFIMVASGLGLFIRGPASRVSVTLGAIVGVALLMCVSARQLATWKNTVTVFSRSVAVDPNNPLAHMNLAVGYSLDKDYKQAIENVTAARELDPHGFMEDKIAAESCLRAGEPVKAVRYYQSACDICQSPDNITSLAWLLSTNPKVRNPEEALRLARQALAIEPSAANLDLFATALASCGKFEQAVQIENRALSGEDSPLIYREHLLMFQSRKMITVE